MAIIDGFIAELKQEAATTRETIARVPDDKLGWSPHPKSMTFGALISHLAESSGWAPSVLDMEALDIPADWKPWMANSTAEALDLFDKNLEASLASMAGYDDANLPQVWRLSMGGQPMFEAPRVAVLRGFVINHLIHHRAQLGVYLRLNDIAVPSVYGPSADEGPKG